MRKTILALSALTILAGCAVPTFTQRQAEQKATEKTAGASQDFAARANVGAVREVTGPVVDFKRSAPAVKRGDINLKAAGAPFGPLVSDLGKRAGYSVSYVDNVDVSRRVTVDFNNAAFEDAVRTTAFLAGYVAVIDKERRSIMVSESATYTFKLPSGVFTALQAAYDIGGDPSSSNSGGGKGGSGGSNLKAKFDISGKEGQAGAALAKLLTDMAGPTGKVVYAESGYVTVTAGAQALRRVSDLLKKVSVEALTQVDIEASIVEVSLGNEFNAGINWQKVIDRASSSLQLATNPGDILNSALTLTRTGASSTSIIQALQRYTDVRIVSQPRLFSMNNTPANFAEVTQYPYLGSLEQTTAATGGAPTVSGSLSFAIDGVMFSVVPSVIDERNVQISLLPVLSSIGNRNDFDLGSSKLTAYVQNNKQSFMRVMAESGKTIILGGIRTGSEKAETSLGAATSSSKTAKEVVILLRANAIVPRSYDPVVAESL